MKSLLLKNNESTILCLSEGTMLFWWDYCPGDLLLVLFFEGPGCTALF